MTPTQRAAMELAISDLEHISAAGGRVEFVERRIAALRAALAEPAPVQETTCKQPLQVHRKPTGWMAHKNQYAVPVLFDPYTGEPRDVRDVQSDPQGVLIVPPGKVEVLAAQQPAPPADVPMLTEDEVEAVQEGIAVDDFAHDLVRRTERLVRQKAGLQ